MIASEFSCFTLSAAISASSASTFTVRERPPRFMPTVNRGFVISAPAAACYRRPDKSYRRCEWVVWITRIDQISPAGTQQVSNVGHRPGDVDARLAGFELALDLDERDVGGIKPTGEDCRNVKRRRRISRKQSRGI